MQNSKDILLYLQVGIALACWLGQALLETPVRGSEATTSDHSGRDLFTGFMLAVRSDSKGTESTLSPSQMHE